VLVRGNHNVADRRQTIVNGDVNARQLIVVSLAKMRIVHLKTGVGVDDLRCFSYEHYTLTTVIRNETVPKLVVAFSFRNVIVSTSFVLQEKLNGHQLRGTVPTTSA